MNCNPSLEESSQYLKKVLNEMLNEMVELIGLNDISSLNDYFKDTKRIKELKEKYTNSKNKSSSPVLERGENSENQRVSPNKDAMSF